jgi:beta-glucosidase
MVEFPKEFFWGAATSSYQVEGNNINSDWWQWEQRVGLKEKSGEACRHYQFYKEDFNIAKQLGHNAHRLSVEWSRIEPRENNFSDQELRHYLEVIDCLNAQGIEPIVTLHHFTNPVWFAESGGWAEKKSTKYFLGYVEKVVLELCERVRFWVTINEPMVYVYHAYILGIWPPQDKSFLKANKVIKNLISAHLQAYRLIHSIYRKNNLSPPLVSIAKNMQAFQPCGHSLRNKLAARLRDELFNFDFINNLIRYSALDFIGINYYSRALVDVRGWRIKNLLLDVCQDNHSSLKKNSLGWDIYPQGLYTLLLKLKRYKLPIFILENGICTDNDTQRWDFIYAHLKSVSLAIKEKVHILGYIYWSLIDNYEWDKGFAPRFGLIEIDYANFRRTPRESAWKFARVCQTARLNGDNG